VELLGAPADLPLVGAHAISADGSVIAGVVASDPSRPHDQDLWRAFRWTQATGFELLPEIPAAGNVLLSADGRVLVSGARRWSDGIVDEIPYINPSGISADGSVIAGRQGGALRLEDGVVSALPIPPLDPDYRGDHAEAEDISADGSTLVGHARRSEFESEGQRYSNWEAAFWRDGVFTSIGALPGDTVAGAFSVSADGSVIGGASGDVAAFRLTAFLWSADGGVLDVKLLLAAQGIDLSGWELWNVTGLSADGHTLFGHGTNPQGRLVGWVATVPEPATALPLAIGSASLALAARARRLAGCARRRAGAATGEA